MALKDSVKSLNGNKTLKAIIIALIIIIVIAVLYGIYKAINTGGNVLGEQLGKQLIQLQTGIQPARQSVCKDVADNCRAAMTITPYLNWVAWVTDDDVVNALNRLVSSDEVALASILFKQNCGLSLKSVLDNNGVFTQISRIRITYYSAVI